MKVLRENLVLLLQTEKYSWVSTGMKNMPSTPELHEKWFIWLFFSLTIQFKPKNGILQSKTEIVFRSVPFQS